MAFAIALAYELRILPLGLHVDCLCTCKLDKNVRPDSIYASDDVTKRHSGVALATIVCIENTPFSAVKMFNAYQNDNFIVGPCIEFK